MDTRNFKPKICTNCRKQYMPTNNHQKLCPTCKTAPRQGIAQRIERLGELSDRHKKLLDARDKAGLLELADHYLQLKHPCTIIARAIRMQAESIQ